VPIYEFKFITFRVSETVSPTCTKCGSERMDRVPSRVRVRLSEETRLERLADPSRLGGLDENDPKSMARWMKKMSHEMGEDFEGEDVDSLIDEAMEEESKGGLGTGEAALDDDI
jgi:hypothetical protein